MPLLHRARFLAVALLGALFAAVVHGQTPNVVIVFKGPGFQQTSPDTLQPFEPGFAAIVTFPAAVATSTSVSLIGPGVTVPLARQLPTNYGVERYFSTEAALDAILPDGNYTVAVSSPGGSPSSTPFTMPTGTGIRAPLFTNYDVLQNWTGGPLTVQWEPIANGNRSDLVRFSVERMDGSTIYESPTFGEPGVLDGTATSVTIPSLNVATGESVYFSLAYIRFNIGFANNNQTIVAPGRGFFLRTLVTRALPPRPTIAIQPRGQTIAAGSTVVFSVGADNATNYQWRRNGTPIAGATGATYLVANAQTAAAGFYTVDVIGAAGSVTSDSVALTVLPTSANPGRITNLAIRSQAGSGAQTLIVGLAVGGAGTTGSKALLVRGVGPALGAFGVSGVLADPRLEVFSGSTRVNENDNWGGDPQVSTIGAQVGAFSLGAATTRDAALYSPSLATGSYSIQVTGAAGTSGVALAEIYDATPATALIATTPRLINVSARTQVGTGSDILIAGFVISGETAKTVLIRAIGPSLTSFGVTGALANSRLDVYAGATAVQRNDDWGGDPTLSTAFLNAGAFPLVGNSRDAALLVTLAPGNYTAQVSGVGNATGVALVEVYEVP